MLDHDEYVRRFTDRVVEQLTTLREDGSPPAWSAFDAREMARAELESQEADQRTDDPEYDADEAMTYWDDDGV